MSEAEAEEIISERDLVMIGGLSDLLYSNFSDAKEHIGRGGYASAIDLLEYNFSHAESIRKRTELAILKIRKLMDGETQPDTDDEVQDEPTSEDPGPLSLSERLRRVNG